MVIKLIFQSLEMLILRLKKDQIYLVEVLMKLTLLKMMMRSTFYQQRKLFMVIFPLVVNLIQNFNGAVVLITLKQILAQITDKK